MGSRDISKPDGATQSRHPQFQCIAVGRQNSGEFFLYLRQLIWLLETGESTIPLVTNCAFVVERLFVVASPGHRYE